MTFYIPLSHNYVILYKFREKTSTKADRNLVRKSLGAIKDVKNHKSNGFS